MSQTGTVRKWDDSKGFGFVSSSDGQDVFVHHTSFGGGSLVVGKSIMFDIEEREPGKMRAANVSGDAVVPRGAAPQTQPGGFGGGGGWGAPAPGGVQEHGTVKRWNDEKGFGFLSGSDGVDVFVHRNALGSSDMSLAEGSPVSYTKLPDPKNPERWRAENVTGPAVYSGKGKGAWGGWGGGAGGAWGGGGGGDWGKGAWGGAPGADAWGGGAGAPWGGAPPGGAWGSPPATAGGGWGAAAPAPAPAPAPAAGGAGMWNKATDPSSGKPYWYNTQTNQTTWDCPPGAQP